MDKETEQQIISRIKVMARLKIDEQRVPQDGRISVRYKAFPSSRIYTIRVSTVPKQLVFGPAEKAVMRILGSMNDTSMEHLGFGPEITKSLETVMAQPQGMFLLTGPTGSGKSTTLAAMLNKLNKEDVNILTIEDPIEYYVPGVTQVQVHEQIGLSFANALRSFLRQDPDIMMLGEIRDSETATMAVRSSLTGHLVLSTLHTNDAPGVIPRLVDLGVEPYLIQGVLMGAMAQRLVKALCPECKQAYEGEALELFPIGFKSDDPNQKVKLFKPKGCAACHDTGFSGRLGIFELMMMSHELREFTSRQKDFSADDIRNLAKKGGMKELRESGLDLVLKGLTTVDQVRRVVYTVETS
jgi:type IV pilus assembly protein PilB